MEDKVGAITSRTAAYGQTNTAAMTRRQCLAWAGGLGLMGALPGCGGDDDAFAEAREWGRQAVRDAMKDHNVRAISVALLVGRDMVWQEGFGVTDGRSAAPTTVATRFNIGSVSKVFAALAVSILVDRGRVTLDTPVVTYLPQFTMRSPEYRQITLRHLLSHTSGLPGTYARDLFATAYLPGYAERQLAWLSEQQIKHPPGEMAVYCNDGFTLVESVVQAVTGQTYSEFVQAAILKPLGMTQSVYPLGPLPEGTFAHGYIDNERQEQEYVMGHATGGLCSTPGDLMKLARMFLNKGVADGVRIVSEAGIAEMGTAQTLKAALNPVPEWQWGLGWDHVRQPALAAAGVQCWEKNGGTILYASEFFVLPGEDMAMMVTGSRLGYNPAAIAEGVLLRALIAKDRLARLPDTVPTTIPAVADATPEAIARLLGIYGSGMAPIRVTSSGSARITIEHWSAQGWAPMVDNLQLRTDGFWWTAMAPTSSFRWMTIDGHQYLLRRERAPSGYYRQAFPVGEKMPAAAAPLSPAWAARMNTQWRVTDEDPRSLNLPGGQSTVTMRELAELPGYVLWSDTQLLRPISDTRATKTVKVPLNAGRDLSDLAFVTAGGREVLHAEGWVLERARA